MNSVGGEGRGKSSITTEGKAAVRREGRVALLWEGRGGASVAVEGCHDHDMSLGRNPTIERGTRPRFNL